jgi:hypothetical protein
MKDEDGLYLGGEELEEERLTPRDLKEFFMDLIEYMFGRKKRR